MTTIYKVSDQHGELYCSSIAKAAHHAASHFEYDGGEPEKIILTKARAAFKSGSNYYGVDGSHYLGIELIEVI